MIKLEYFTEDDFQQLIDWIPTAEFTLQWGGPAFKYPLTKEQLLSYLKGANINGATKYIFKVVDITNNKVIGHVSLGSVDRLNQSARVGKVLVGSIGSRGKGYGTKLMNAILKFAFGELKLHKVTLGVFDFNYSAIRCYKKVGFQQEGLLRDARKNRDEYWSLIEMGILENEWKEKVDC